MITIMTSMKLKLLIKGGHTTVKLSSNSCHGSTSIVWQQFEGRI